MLGTYAELQQAIADTLHRDDLAADIPSFIHLFEARANRYLRGLMQETTVTLTLAAGNSFIALPANFLEILTANVLLANQPQLLVQQNADAFDNGFVATTFPTYYSVYAGNIAFDAIADQDYLIALRYLKGLDLAADLTNWLLTSHPDAYLYGALAAAALYLQDDGRVATWAQLAASAMEEINLQASRTKQRTLLSLDPALIDRGGAFNINRGY